MATAGFDERRFPDARVLRTCRANPHITISQVGRELGISRQAAGKLVTDLRGRGYVTVAPSPSSGREKAVELTQKAYDYLIAHRDAARAIDRQISRELGPDVFAAVAQLLDVLGADEEDRLRAYLREKGVHTL